MNGMLETPDYSCWYRYSDDVYEPAEDTFIFLDGLEEEIKKGVIHKTGFGVELGCGSGLVSTALKKWTGLEILLIDINPKAIECSQLMLESNKISGDLALSRSGINLRANIADFILINPPYVVTSNEELIESQNECSLEASWAGGKDGTKLLFESLLPNAIRLLAENGIIYLIAIRENKIENIKSFLGKEFTMEKVIERKAGIELLSLLKISRNKPVL